MARIALGLGVRELASAADVSPNTIARFERGDPTIKESTVTTIRAVFEASGLEFIAENGGGIGVRFAKPGTDE